MCLHGDPGVDGLQPGEAELRDVEIPHLHPFVLGI